MADIDALSDKLGIPWEKAKDIPFATTVPFIGFLWDLTGYPGVGVQAETHLGRSTKTIRKATTRLPCRSFRAHLPHQP
ncbi:hypothetical protein K443DRAFT_686274 [Laccaria amethystina LaAM-08-1]|uniref:Uncharacterized protein n=1 Tax=Laccaria amethystina LaAM-08-1 TaxID=1095629 RepID=A0A0C9WHG4_9AGAR|nr:hypothetical protein K443DRAFT_686274 [Laccaria amethystina LaAM-08-1]